MPDVSEAKRQLLQQRLAARVSTAAPAPPSIPTRPAGPPPLSAGQSALLYEHRLRPDDAGYNVVHAYRLPARVDRSRLGDAIRRAAARHEPLRHGFGPDRRRLAEADAIEVTEVSTDEAGFEALARRHATERFDLLNGPLLRATLVAVTPDPHVGGDRNPESGAPALEPGDGTGSAGLVLAAHHVSCDAASLAQLWRDIDAAYRGEELVEPTVSYSDHAVWQAARRSGADTSFWLEHLGGEGMAPELPLAPPVPAQPDGYRTMSLEVTPPQLAGLGSRPAPVFLGLFAALLQRYTDTDDVVVGLTASTRDHPAVQSLVGYFLNLLPLRLAVDPDSSIEELVRRTDTTLVAALARRHVPYAEIAAALRRDGAPSAHPARIMFVLDEQPRIMLDGMEVGSTLIHNERAVTDLTVFVRRVHQRYELSVEWDGSRFAAADVASLMDEYATLVSWAVRHPGSPLRAAPAQPDLVGPALPRPLRPLPETISEQCRATPAAVAVRCGEGQLTYDELRRRVSATAGGLAARGVTAGDRVAVGLERSTDLVVAVLAVQWLGAAYVPVDPDYPPSRARLIVDIAQPALTIVSPPARDVLADGGDGDDGDRARAGPMATVDQLCADNGIAADPVATLDDPAYVIFTSGSTGIPRGVAIGQRQLAASTAARLQHYVEPVGRYLLVSSFGFDSSVAGLFWTLATGGELVLPTESEVHDVDALVGLAQRQRVTHLLMVPTLYQAMLARAGSGLGSLRCAIVAGEACPASLVARHHEVVSAATMWNEYGPTEATVWTTVHRCLPDHQPVPIGMVIPGAVVRVVDRWLRPRPIGAAGELAVGGPGLAPGYLNNAPDTARAFVDDPAGAGRFYRSGDLVRRDEHGTLMFLGRIDHQLSVGGTRFEPEEIEAALMDAGGRAALVRVERQLDGDVLDTLMSLPHEATGEMLQRAASSPNPARALAEALAVTSGGRDVLVAYVEGDGLDRDTLRVALRRRLPATAVPSIIELVPALARTEHGKVDRRALPPPLRTTTRGDGNRPGGDGRRDVTAPIVEVWRAVLGDESLGADSDFFEAGGDSLLAVEVATRLEQRLGRRVPISALVLGRTPARLQSLLDTAPALTPLPTQPACALTAERSHVVPLRSAGTRPPLLIMPPGGGNLIVFDPLVQALDPSLPVIGFDLPGFDRDEDLPTSVESLCDTYLPQLRAVQPGGPYRLLGWSFGGVVALELAQRLTAQGEEVDLVAMIDTLVPGMQRRGRGRAYLALIRQGDLPGVARKLFHTVRVRLTLGLVRRKGRRAHEQGATLEAMDRNTWLTIKVDEFVERYHARPYSGRVVFFAATSTLPWRTTDPWRQLIADFEVVPIDGAHDGADGLLAGDRARFIAGEVAARLR